MKGLKELLVKLEAEIKKGHEEWKQEQLDGFVNEGRATAMCMMGELPPESKLPKIDIEQRFVFTKEFMLNIKRYVDLSIENSEERINKRIDELESNFKCIENLFCDCECEEDHKC